MSLLDSKNVKCTVFCIRSTTFYNKDDGKLIEGTATDRAEVWIRKTN